MVTSPSTTPPRSAIRQLSTSVINKIAAGEVIERPASVIKELLENAIDAGATRIEVAVENGGLDLMRVTDNGCGIPCDELLLAVASHATSKIQDAEDLFRVGTFGFRGEALASIAEISEFSLKSKTANQESCYELIVRGGQAAPVEPCGGPTGTTITVENLFFNTPVRRKFLKSSQTELGHISEAFTRVALAHPDRHLSLWHNGKQQYQLAPTDDWGLRIADFFGPEIGDALIPISSQTGDIRLSGYIVDPQVTRSHNRLQYLFLNGRYIRDRALQHALSEAYRGLIMTQRFPLCFLRLEMPFEQVDVNVHPAKLEVRFQDGGRIYSQLLATIRNKFLTTDLTARGNWETGPSGARSGEPTWGTAAGLPSESGSPPAVGRGTFPPPRPYPDLNPAWKLRPPTEELQSRLDFPTAPPRDWISQPVGQPPAPHAPLPHNLANPAAPDYSGGDFSPRYQNLPGTPPTDNSRLSPGGPSGSEVAAPLLRPSSPPEFVGSAPPSSVPNRMLALQVHDTYLITETNEGLVIIDQHALHERVLYEQLKDKVTRGQMESQRLLVPEPVTLPPAEVSLILNQAQTLSELGIAVEPFGGDTVLVSAYPAMLANHSPAELLRSVIDKLALDGAQLNPQDLLDELLHMIACKAAIKAGDRLSREEIEDLIAFRDLCRDAHHCPHGRPTALVFSREELDKKFKRI